MYIMKHMQVRSFCGHQKLSGRPSIQTFCHSKDYKVIQPVYNVYSLPVYNVSSAFLKYFLSHTDGYKFITYHVLFFSSRNTI